MKKFILPILCVLLVATSAAAFYFYSQSSSLPKKSEPIGQEEVASLVAKIGQLIVLPEGETPTVATVSDPDKLKDQTFFANAKAGDKVLIYANAKKAFLYDPVNNKIVEVAPLNIGAATSPSPTLNESATSTTR